MDQTTVQARSSSEIIFSFFLFVMSKIKILDNCKVQFGMNDFTLLAWTNFELYLKSRALDLQDQYERFYTTSIVKKTLC